MGDANKAVFRAVQNMLERHINSEYFFYGDEERNTECKPIKQFPGITNLVELFSVLECCWDENTVYPPYKDNWSSSDSSYGQCEVTAVLVYDMFGGTIHRVKVSDGSIHYFNKINDRYVDLTREHYDLCGIPVKYEPNNRASKDYCCRKEETVERYRQLQRNIIYYLRYYEDDFWED